MNADLYIPLVLGEQLHMQQHNGYWRIWLDSKNGVGVIIGEGTTRKWAMFKANGLLCDAITKLQIEQAAMGYL